MKLTAHGTFDITLTPGAPEAGGEVNRLDFTKTFHGDLAGTGTGLMLAVGDPTIGEAGYVAIETVDGRVGDLDGSFALQQLGQMHGGEQLLHYLIVPGSGQGQLTGIVGALHLTIDADGTHNYVLDYSI